MKIRSPWLIRLLALCAAWLIRAWMGTLRVRVAFLGDCVHPADPRRERYIYAFWHEDLLVSSTQKARIHMLVSRHADGELIAQVAHHLGKGTVRGSTTRGGAKALLELMRLKRPSHLGVTPDGPKGPRRRVQIGLIFLASQTGLPIVPFGVGYVRGWRAKSWDRFAVPWPGSTVVGVVAPAIHVPPNLSRSQLESYRQLVESQMRAMSDAAERWAAGGPRPQLASMRRAA